MANFAKAQLMKYGWTEGKGLGRNENGITEALRPKLKFDTVGVGHKDTDSHQWWEVAFNKAASNIVVDSQSNGVAISSLKRDDQKKVKKLKGTSKYRNFLKTSTLCDGNLIQENSFDKVEGDSTESDIIFPQMTDEELFKACGGRTAHKGARHGLTLNGKLERIAQQEKKLLGTLGSVASTGKSSKSKSQRAQRRESEDGDEMDSNANTILPSPLATVDEPCYQLSKSSRKKQKRRINDLTYKLNTLCSMNDDQKEAEHNATDSGKTKRKKQLKRRRSKDRKESTNAESTKATSEVDTGSGVSDIPLPPSQEKKRSKVSNETIDAILSSWSSDFKKLSVAAPTGYEYRTLKSNVSQSKKKKTIHRKSQLKLDRITDNLMAVHFDADDPPKPANPKQKMETITQNLMAIDIAENVTKSKKKKSRK